MERIGTKSFFKDITVSLAVGSLTTGVCLIATRLAGSRNMLSFWQAPAIGTLAGATCLTGLRLAHQSPESAQVSSRQADSSSTDQRTSSIGTETLSSSTTTSSSSGENRPAGQPESPGPSTASEESEALQSPKAPIAQNTGIKQERENPSLDSLFKILHQGQDEIWMTCARMRIQLDPVLDSIFADVVGDTLALRQRLYQYRDLLEPRRQICSDLVSIDHWRNCNWRVFCSDLEDNTRELSADEIPKYVLFAVWAQTQPEYRGNRGSIPVFFSQALCKTEDAPGVAMPEALTKVWLEQTPHLAAELGDVDGETAGSALLWSACAYHLSIKNRRINLAIPQLAEKLLKEPGLTHEELS